MNFWITLLVSVLFAGIAVFLLVDGYGGLTKGEMTVVGVRGYINQVSGKEAKFFGIVYLTLGVVLSITLVTILFAVVL